MTRKTALAAALVAEVLGIALGPRAAGAPVTSGQVTHVGGQGIADGTCRDEHVDHADDGTASLGAARFSYHSLPSAIAVDAMADHIFVGDRGFVRDVAGLVAGSTSPTAAPFGSGAEGKDPRSVTLGPIKGLSVDAKRRVLYILEVFDDSSGQEAGRVRRVDFGATTPTIRTVGFPEGTHSLAEQTAATSVTEFPEAMAADDFGHVFVVGRSRQIRRVDVSTGTVVPVAIMADPPKPGALAVDPGGTTVFAAAPASNIVERIDVSTGSKSTFAGTGMAGYAGDNGPATTAELSSPRVVALDPRGLRLYIADRGNTRIRSVDLSSGIIDSLVGSGASGFQATGTASNLSLATPNGLAVDLEGTLFILDGDSCAVLQVYKPVPLPIETGVSNPQSPPNPNQPVDPKSTSNSQNTTNSNPAVNQVTRPGQSDAGQAQIPSGGQGQNATNLQVTDPGGSAANAPPAAQPGPGPAPGPSAGASVTPPAAPAPLSAAPVNPVVNAPASQPVAPQPVGAPPPAAPVSPAAGAPAPVPVPAPPPAAGPAAGTSPPPAAPHPVANVGLAGPGGDAPTPKGAARYAMVRADEDSSTATLAMAVGALALAAFICVLFVAPGASSRPKPRPKGAY